MQIRPEWVQPELEGRHDPEVPAGSADPPEQLGLLRGTRPDDSSVGRDELDRPQAVDSQAEVALQPADAAA
jgi:hypothetical protein